MGERALQLPLRKIFPAAGMAQLQDEWGKLAGEQIPAGKSGNA